MRLLNDVLDYSKIEAGKLDLEITNFTVAAQLQSVVALFEPHFAAKAVALTINVESDVPRELQGDPGRLRQILSNLGGNALKFTPGDGSVAILVTAESTCNNRIPIRFSVTDTGLGITSDVRHRLFHPFSQGDESTTRRYGGTGLGLSICKQLVELMGGTIDVASAGAGGSCFWFTLPCAQSSSEHVFDAPTGSMGERRATPRPRPEKLLLAEDNEVNARVAIGQLKQLGYALTVVADGRDAVRAVHSDSYDLLFMDCHMPEMDGFDATRLIRSLTPREQSVCRSSR